MSLPVRDRSEIGDLARSFQHMVDQVRRRGEDLAQSEGRLRAILDTAAAQQRARPLLRAFGAISSKWYLLFSPLVFAVVWLGVCVFSLVR